MPPRRFGRQNRTAVQKTEYDQGRKGRTRKPKHDKNIFGAATAVCGRGSIVGRGSTYYIVGLVPCYPVCHLLPALSAAFSLRPLPSPVPIPLDATHNGCGRDSRKNGLMWRTHISSTKHDLPVRSSCCFPWRGAGDTQPFPFGHILVYYIWYQTIL